MKLKSKDRNIWFISDTHYSHKNMCRAGSNWENKETGSRDFSSISKMNDDMVNKINEVVMPDDILFHLGDWSMGGYDNIAVFRQRLNVSEIHLIMGNHDEHIKKDKEFDFSTHNREQFSHLKTRVQCLYDIPVSAQEMFTSVQDYLEITIDKQQIVLSHFPIISWNNLSKGSWHLHGHTHGNLFPNVGNEHWYKTSKILDVGIDNYYKLFNEYGIFSFRELKSIMNKRDIVINDYNRVNQLK